MKNLDDFVLKLQCKSKDCKDTYYSANCIEWDCRTCGKEKRVSDIYEKGWATEYVSYCICSSDEEICLHQSEVFQIRNMHKVCDICRKEYKVYSLFKLIAES